MSFSQATSRLTLVCRIDSDIEQRLANREFQHIFLVLVIRITYMRCRCAVGIIGMWCKPTGLPNRLPDIALDITYVVTRTIRLSLGLISYDHHPLVLSLSPCAFSQYTLVSFSLWFLVSHHLFISECFLFGPWSPNQLPCDSCEYGAVI